MSVSVRQQIRTASLTDEGDIHLRLAALYHLRRSSPKDFMQVIHEIVQQPLSSTSLSGQPLLFQLHAAVLLAQAGKFDGVRWLLDAQGSGVPSQRRLVSKALRNCSRFPFATLAGNLFEDCSGILDDAPLVQLLQRSDEELGKLQKEKHIIQNAMLDQFRETFDSSRHPRQPGLRCDLGVVLRRPAINDQGFQWTGFLGIESEGIGLPFGMEHIINPDDESATESVNRMLGTEGRRAVVVWTDLDGYKAAFVYVLPFGLMQRSEVQQRLVQQACDGRGVEVGVLVGWTREKERYKVVATNGYSTADRYAIERQKLGNCFFYHPKNSGRLLSSTFRLNRDEQALFLDSFLHRNHDRLGVVIRLFKGNDKKTMMHIVHAESGEERVFPAEENVEPGTTALWEFSEQQSKWYTNLLDGFRIQANCANCFCCGKRICPKCEGTNWGTCSACNGSRTETCGHCDGTTWKYTDCNCDNGVFRPECRKCHGTGECQACDGDGRYLDSGRTCKKCDGDNECDWCDGKGHSSLTCKYCKGTGQQKQRCRTCSATPGLWNCKHCHGKGKSTCNKCNGDRLVACECGGRGKWMITTT